MTRLITEAGVAAMDPKYGDRLALLRGSKEIFIYRWGYNRIRSRTEWELIEYDSTGELFDVHARREIHRIAL